MVNPNAPMFSAKISVLPHSPLVITDPYNAPMISFVLESNGRKQWPEGTVLE